MEKIRIVLADDHPIVRKGIFNLLDKEQDIDVIGEASDGEQAIQLTNRLKPDILLLDMEMPGLGGVDVAKRLRADNSPVKILVLSAYNDKQYILELLDLGATGYLTKDEAPTTIVQAVRGVAKGQEGWLSDKVASRMNGWKRQKTPSSLKLNTREQEVLTFLGEGLNNQQIGRQMGISDKTVEKYCISILRKLGVKSRREAIELSQQTSNG
jgi:two-component system response regulator DegU